MLAIRLPQEIEKQLAALAKRTGRTKTFYARQAILNLLEDFEDARIADKAMKEFDAGDQKTTPLADLIKKYGLED